MNESIRQILSNTQYCTIATVREDGSPWNVPVRFAHDEEYLYFRSPAGTTHGLSIERDGRVAVVVVDTNQSVKGAVYIHSFAQKLEGEEEARAVRVFNERFNNPPDQWENTEYYKVGIGEIDESRTVAAMYYFQNRSTV